MPNTKSNSRGLSITVPTQLLRRIHSHAADRMRRGERGGVSATVRELLARGLEAPISEDAVEAKTASDSPEAA
jgi:hypothetical protein